MIKKDQEKIKRSYYFPETLVEKWENFHPGKKHGSSPEAAWMLLFAFSNDFGIRELAGRLAYEDNIDAAAERLREEIRNQIIDSATQKALSDLKIDPDELLGLLSKLQEKSSEK